MPHISQRGELMPSSPIRKLVPFAEKAKKQGKKILHLNIGQPDIPTPKHVFESLKKIDSRNIAYSNSNGFKSYRDKLSSYYSSHKIDLNPDEIIVTAGGSEALLFTFLSCFNPGDEVIIPEPYYANYNGFASTSGVNVVPITSSIDSGFALPSIDKFSEKIGSRTKGILLCNPGNPSGCLYSKEDIIALGELAQKNDLFLIADEVYREFCYEGHRHFSIMQLEAIKTNCILIDSVSKRYSMCGARIGAFATKNKKVLETAMKYAQARLSPPTLGQIASESAIDTPESYFKDVISEYVTRRDILVNGLNKLPGVKCPMPQGAFYAIAELPIDDSEKFCQWLLEEFSFQNTTVMLAPASGFYSSKELGKKQVRIAYVLEEEELKLALKCIKAALEEYSKN